MCDNLCAESTIETAFDAAKLQDSIPAIKEAVAARGNIKQQKEIFTPCGIELISVRHFNGVPVQGFKCQGARVVDNFSRPLHNATLA